MVACAADEIICDDSSIVGSIGVVGGSFGFAKLHGQARHRAAALCVGRAQGDARSVPAGETRGRGAPQGGAARDSRGLHRSGQASRRRAAQGSRENLVLRRILDRRQKRSSSGWPTVSATCARACASASARMWSRRWCSRRAAGSAACSRELAALDECCAAPDLAEDIVSALEARAMWARYGL